MQLHKLLQIREMYGEISRTQAIKYTVRIQKIKSVTTQIITACQIWGIKIWNDLFIL